MQAEFRPRIDSRPFLSNFVPKTKLQTVDSKASTGEWSDLELPPLRERRHQLLKIFLRFHRLLQSS
jgi:hypothetical protein